MAVSNEISLGEVQISGLDDKSKFQRHGEVVGIWFKFGTKSLSYR